MTTQDAAPDEPVEEMHRPHRLTMLVAALAMVVTAWLLSGSAAEGWHYLAGGLRTPEGTERIQHAADQVGAGLLLIGALAQAVRASAQAPKSARKRDDLDLFGWACVVAGAVFALLALI